MTEATRRKYELVADSKVSVFGVELFRVRALISFGCISAGDIGGYVQAEANLDHGGNAWVYGNARVSGNAWVYGDALVSGDAWVYGDALVSGNAWVYGDALVYGDARVSGNAWVYGDALVSGDAWVSGNARVFGDAILQLGPIGSRRATLTATLTAAGGIQVATGCFTDSLECFAAAVETTHGDSDHGRNYRAAIECIRAVAAGWPKPEADAAEQPQQVAA